MAGWLEVVSRVVARRGEGQDRVGVTFENGLLVVVADGAGGTFGGAEAAEAIVKGVHDLRDVPSSELLASLDRQLAEDGRCGESTAVVASITVDSIRGASVGDSIAWLVDEDGATELTENQRRKPLLGSGRAAPVDFSDDLGSATLLLASDGLVNYATREAITRLAVGPDLEHAADAMVDLVRLASRELQDDVSVVLIRRTRGE